MTASAPSAGSVTRSLRAPAGPCSAERSKPAGPGATLPYAPSQVARDVLASAGSRAGSTTTTTEPGADGSAHAGHAVRRKRPPVCHVAGVPAMDEVGIAKSPSRRGAATPTKVAVPPGVDAMAVGCAPTCRKLKPGVVGSASSTLLAETSTTATSPRVVCVTSASTCGDVQSVGSLGGLAEQPSAVRPRTPSKQTKLTAPERSSERTGTLMGCCEHASSPASAVNAASATSSGAGLFTSSPAARWGCRPSRRRSGRCRRGAGRGRRRRGTSR